MTKNFCDTTLSKDQLPSCWNDDVRMTALFAPFRLKSVNPTDYDSKMKFWTEMITKWSQNKGSYTYDEICTAFQRNGKYPACIETVMENMIKYGKLCLKCKVQSAPQGWLGWGVSTALRPASWAASAFMTSIGKGTPAVDRTARYVHLEALQNQSLAFLSSIAMDKRLGSKEELWQASCKNGFAIDCDNLDMMLSLLKGKNLAICTPDGKLYKLSHDGTTKVKPLTEGEICLPRLEAVKENLEKSIDKMKSSSDETRLMAKQSLTKGDKKLALGHLRKKKLIESRMEKAINNFDSIVHLIETVKQAHSDSEVFDAFKSGVSALKITMKHKGLEEDYVMDTMDEIKDTLDTYNDIETAISQPIGMTFDKDELERELKELVEGDFDEREDGGVGGGKGGKKEENEEIFKDLPEVPKTNIKGGKGDDMDDFHKSMEKRLKNLRLTSNS